MATKRKSRILDEVHETALGLRSSGLISKRSMLKFDVLCDLEVKQISPKQIRQLREKENVSQAVFAAILNISVSTIQKWELGDKKPSGSSLKLLNILDRKGLQAVL
jgi:putative transcriptional regulator